MNHYRSRSVTVVRSSRDGLFLRALLPTLLLAAVLFFASLAQARGAPESFAPLVDRLLPSVVNISTTQTVEGAGNSEFEELFREFFERRGIPQGPQNRGQEATSLGSGFVVDAEGYIVTNNHVIEGADEITVILQDDTELPATLIGTDAKTDLALLKVESDSPLSAVEWGDSDELQVGDWVIAIGNPFGLGGTVTAGILSARSRNIDSGPYDDFLQTDAAINKGNSGGPMFNLDGRVVGVNSAIYSPTGGSVGIGFAIPSAMAENVIAQLRENGQVRRGWLGVRIQTVTPELAEGLRLPAASGALVASVTVGGPADEAGIQQGDVILEFNGQDVGEMSSLPRMVAETPIGQAVDIVVWRKGEEEVIRVDLGELNDDQLASLPEGSGGSTDGTPNLVDALGLGLAAITPESRQQFGLDNRAKGVVIINVEDASSSAEKGLQPGDVIVEVDQEEVETPSDVTELVERAQRDGYKVVTLLVYRSGDYQWIAVRLDS